MLTTRGNECAARGNKGNQQNLTFWELHLIELEWYAGTVCYVMGNWVCESEVELVSTPSPLTPGVYDTKQNSIFNARYFRKDSCVNSQFVFRVGNDVPLDLTLVHTFTRITALNSVSVKIFLWQSFKSIWTESEQNKISARSWRKRLDKTHSEFNFYVNIVIFLTLSIKDQTGFFCIWSRRAL